MANYTWKMWNIPGDELETSMVWADRFHHAYTQSSRRARAPRAASRGYDPLKFEDHTLGKGIAFQVYPKHGWNAVWGAMVARVDRDPRSHRRHPRRAQAAVRARSPSGEKHYFADYHTVFCSIDIDELWGEDTLPYTGRMMIPLLIPGLAHAFPEGAESLHYSSCEFQTRVTEMKVITRHESPDTLILIEVPVLPGAAECFPRNTIDYALEHNLFAEKAYPQQSEQAFATYHGYVDRGEEDPEPALRRASRRIQVLGHAGDGQLGVPEGARVPGGVMAAVHPRVLAVDDVAQARAAAADARGVRARSACATSISTCTTSSKPACRSTAVADAVAAHGHAAVGGVRRLVRFLPSTRRRSSDTFASVARQVDDRAPSSASRTLRLFFGRLPARGLFAGEARDIVCDNLSPAV